MRRVIFNPPNFDNSMPFATALELDCKDTLSNLCHVLDTRRNATDVSAIVAVAGPGGADSSAPVQAPQQPRRPVAATFAQQEQEQGSRDPNKNTINDKHPAATSSLVSPSANAATRTEPSDLTNTINNKTTAPNALEARGGGGAGGMGGVHSPRSRRGTGTIIGGGDKSNEQLSLFKAMVRQPSHVAMHRGGRGQRRVDDEEDGDGDNGSAGGDLGETYGGPNDGAEEEDEDDEEGPNEFASISRGTSCAATDCGASHHCGEGGSCSYQQQSNTISGEEGGEEGCPLHANRGPSKDRCCAGVGTSVGRSARHRHGHQHEHRRQRHVAGHGRGKLRRRLDSLHEAAYYNSCGLQSYVSGVEYHLDIPSMALPELKRRVDNVVAAVEAMGRGAIEAAEAFAAAERAAQVEDTLVDARSASAPAGAGPSSPLSKTTSSAASATARATATAMAVSAAALDPAMSAGRYDTVPSHVFALNASLVAPPAAVARQTALPSPPGDDGDAPSSPTAALSRVLRSARVSLADLTLFGGGAQSSTSAVPTADGVGVGHAVVNDAIHTAEGTTASESCAVVGAELPIGDVVPPPGGDVGDGLATPLRPPQQHHHSGDGPSPATSATPPHHPPTATGGSAALALVFPPPMKMVAAFECWVCVFVWLRKAAVQMMRTLARAYSEHQWCLKYWLWAEKHPYQLELHHLFSLQFRTSLPIAVHRVSQAKINISTLSREDDLLIESIGVIHSALMALNDSLADVANSILRTGEEGYDELLSMDSSARDLGSPITFTAGGGGDSLLSSPLPEGGVDAHQQQQRASSALYQSDEAAFYSIAVRFLKAINKAHACSEDWGCAPSSSPSAAGRGQSTPPSPPPSSLTYCWSGLLAELSLSTSRCEAFVTDHREKLQRRAYPPVGRNWARMLVASCVALPLAYGAMYRLHSEDFPKSYTAVWDSVAAYVQSWVWLPTKDLFGALTHVRPDAAQQRQYFQSEKDLTAKVTTDFIREQRPGVTAEELERIGNAARNGDLSVIHDAHALAVQRPFYSFLFGPLVRLMLIQLQEQKMAMTGVIISSDEVLASNDFNFKMFAMAPVVLGFYSGVLMYRNYRAHKKYPIYSRLKLCWRDLHRLVERSEVSAGASHGNNGNGAFTQRLGARPLGGGGAVPATPLLMGGRSPPLTDMTALPSTRGRGRAGDGSDDDDAADDDGAFGRDPASILHTARGTPSAFGRGPSNQTPPPQPYAPLMNALSRGAPASSAGGLTSSKDLASLDQGKALLIIHEMRGLCEKIPEYPLVAQFLEDLTDFESSNNSRARRLRCLERMMQTHPILHSTFMPMLK